MDWGVGADVDEVPVWGCFLCLARVTVVSAAAFNEEVPGVVLLSAGCDARAASGNVGVPCRQGAGKTTPTDASHQVPRSCFVSGPDDICLTNGVRAGRLSPYHSSFFVP